MTERVSATTEAIELIERLKEKHGPLAFLRAGGTEEGAAKCLTRAELIPREEDVKLGAICGSPVFADRAEYERQGRPALLIDVAEGPAGTFSLEELEDLHFISRSQPAPGRQT